MNRTSTELRAKVLAALEQACRSEACHEYSFLRTSNWCQSDQQAVRYGPLTPKISSYIDAPISMAQLRNILNAEVTAGRVLKDQDRTGGMIRLWPIGLWDKIVAERAAVDEITARLNAELADFAGKPMNVQDITERVDNFLASLAAQPSVKVIGAKLTGDGLHVDVEMPRWLAIEAGLVPPEPIEFTVDIERAAQEGGAV